MVPRVHIYLSAPGINHLTLSQFGLMLITAAGLVLSIAFWWIGTTLHENIDALETKTQMINTHTMQVKAQAEAKGIDLSPQAIQEIPPHISFVKQVRERVGFSWTKLLTDLESTVPKKLMMSTVSLDDKTNTVLLSGSTESLKDLNGFIHQLDTHQAFHDVILTQHAKKKSKRATRQSFIVFSLKVSYDTNHQHSKSLKS